MLDPVTKPAVRVVWESVCVQLERYIRPAQALDYTPSRDLGL